MNKELQDLIEKANQLTLKHHGKDVWFGRCIFLSWYCDVGDCKFCYRSTQKSRIKHAEKARRSLPSVIVEAVLAKNLGWRIEFLTGGYKIFPMDELLNFTKIVSEIFGEKIWLNLGALEKQDLDQFRPYIGGIVSSIETIDKDLHNEICPSKPIAPYEKMFSYSKDLKKSMTIVIGLGEKKEHYTQLKEFIQKYKLDRITFYALRPVQGTPYTEGPTTEDYAWWIAKTRIDFPELQIIAGTAPNRVKEIGTILKSGANAITKFPSTKMFNSPEAQEIESQIKNSGRNFTSTLTTLPDIDWDSKIDSLNIDKETKEQAKQTLKDYLNKMSN